MKQVQYLDKQDFRKEDPASTFARKVTRLCVEKMREKETETHRKRNKKKEKEEEQEWIGFKAKTKTQTQEMKYRKEEKDLQDDDEGGIPSRRDSYLHVDALPTPVLLKVVLIQEMAM